MHATLVEKEYGVPATVAGAKMWARISSTRPSRRIAAAAQYVGICRRLARGGGGVELEGEAAVDGRLVAAGFRRVPPMEWIRGERRDGRAPRLLADFVEFWEATQDRPETVGSSYNVDPETTFAVWSARPGVRWAATQIPAQLWPGMLRGGRRWTRHARPIGIALRRASLGYDAPTVSAQALRRLGGLCPELQRVALRGAAGRAGQGAVVRLRHLDWAAVARLARALEADATGRVRAAASLHEYRDRDGYRRRSKRFEELAYAATGSYDPVDVARWLCPAYPHAPVDVAARICAGDTPSQASGGVLTRREAHQWLSAGGERTPIEWLVRHLDLAGARVRSPLIARWLLDVHRRGGWGGLTKTRTAHGPAGAVAEYRYLDRVDEVQDTDLARGVKTSVDEAFRAAAERSGAAWLETQRTDHRLLAEPPAWRWYPCMRPLVTRAQLVREGDDLGHCVGGYSSAVKSRQSVLVALNVAGHRSTAELTPKGHVLQHRGPKNEEPHRLCKTVLARFVERRIGT